MRDILVRMIVVLAVFLAAGCGGQGIDYMFVSQRGTLTGTDQLLNNTYYYDAWTFVPGHTKRGVFKMLSNNLNTFIILKNDKGETIQTGSSSGYDEDGNFDGDASLGALLFEGQTYTVITTSQNSHEVGAYTIEWPDWVTLTGTGY